MNSKKKNIITIVAVAVVLIILFSMISRSDSYGPFDRSSRPHGYVHDKKGEYVKTTTREVFKIPKNLKAVVILPSFRSFGFDTAGNRVFAKDIRKLKWTTFGEGYRYTKILGDGQYVQVPGYLKAIKFNGYAGYGLDRKDYEYNTKDVRNSDWVKKRSMSSRRFTTPNAFLTWATS